MKGKFKFIVEKCLAITVAVMMAATCFAVVNTDYSFAASKKVVSITLTNVGDSLVMKKGKTMKLKYSIVVSKNKKKYKKVKWKSSNKKVVSVSKKGKITAKKNGTAYITVYSKKNKKIKDRVKIRVWTPVSSVKFGSTVYVRKDKQKKLSVTVKPSTASNKKLTWVSSDTSIATVSQNGTVTGKQKGTVTIRATSKDGTKKTGTVKVKIIELNRSDAVFIAHRGYSAYAPENTVPAFRLASQGDFQGAEMDVWESFTYQKEVENPDYVTQGIELETKGEAPQNKDDEAAPQEDESVTQDDEYVTLSEDETVDLNEGEEAIEGESEDLVVVEEEDEGEPTVLDESKAEVKDEGDIPPTIMVDEFDLNIMHNQSIKDMCGKNVDIRSVNDTNRDQYPIKSGNNISNYPGTLIPTLEDVLKTLYETNQETGHDTQPVIELKQNSYSAAAINRIFDLIEQYGGKATIVSFNENALIQVKREIDERVASDTSTIQDGDIQIQYLVRSNSKSNVDKCVSRGFNGISIKYTEMTKTIVDYAHNKGLTVAAWTLPSMTEAARMIDLGVDRITSDYKLFVGN